MGPLQPSKRSFGTRSSCQQDLIPYFGVSPRTGILLLFEHAAVRHRLGRTQARPQFDAPSAAAGENRPFVAGLFVLEAWALPNAQTSDPP